VKRLQILLLLLLTAIIPQMVRAADDASRPNVLIIVSDDHGFGDIGWNNPEVKTPNLKASRGRR